ncbi:hypothetical protein M5K25_008644 [Dendrobium thyrsiflorum]|uniref:Protein kinase domain-containing protein n=1 Tax=Dendrobium thyrsiflorum TaxID=117978 RepID=A0ABD0V8M5_DENTH
MGSSSFSFHDLRFFFLPTDFRICASSFPISCNGCRRLVVYFQHFLYHVPEIRYLSFHGGHSFLHCGNRRSGRTSLNWETRISIAQSAARGIGYIHSTSPTASHGNIKSSNIFFNKSHTACVSDNGLAALVNPSSSPSLVSGYRAPELTKFLKISQKADVYSFGVLLLELLTGKSPEEGFNLPQLVQEVLREEWSTDVLDLELLRQQNVEEMVQLLQIAINCTVRYPDSRPSMQEVMAQIEVISSRSRDAVEAQAQQQEEEEEEEVVLSGNEAVNL